MTRRRFYILMAVAGLLCATVVVADVAEREVDTGTLLNAFALGVTVASIVYCRLLDRAHELAERQAEVLGEQTRLIRVQTQILQLLGRRTP